jgi:hypothetical protein
MGPLFQRCRRRGFLVFHGGDGRGGRWPEGSTVGLKEQSFLKNLTVVCQHGSGINYWAHHWSLAMKVRGVTPHGSCCATWHLVPPCPLFLCGVGMRLSFGLGKLSLGVEAQGLGPLYHSKLPGVLWHKMGTPCGDEFGQDSHCHGSEAGWFRTTVT